MSANDSSEAKPTMAAPNNVTGAPEVSAVVADSSNEAEKATNSSQSPGQGTNTKNIASAPATATAEQTEVSKEKPENSSADPGQSLTNIEQLWTASKEVNYSEIWGVTLSDPSTHVPSQIIFQKYLNANDGDLAKAKDQLTKTLEWRSKTKPLELLTKSFSREKFAGLGFVTTYTDDTESGPEGKEVFTWNIYGAAIKDIDKTFGDLDAFIEWRVALMELAMHQLDLSKATKPISAEHDPYKIYQVHDYQSVSFFRSPPAVRSAAKKTVEVLAMAYPETLKEKFFINVPAIMGFMYGVMKLFVAPKTIKKFHPMSNGGALAAEFSESKVKGLGEKLPQGYGGKGDSLTITGKEPALTE